MNINLHIDSIVLDGIDLGPGQSHLLQQAVSSQLMAMLTAQSGELPFAPSDRIAHQATNSICLGQTVDVNTLSPQLATAIYANIPQSHFGPRTTN